MNPAKAPSAAWRDEAAVAALALQPFAVLLAALVARAGITPTQLGAADPLIQVLGSQGIPFVAPFAGGVGLWWWLAVRPGGAARARGLRRAGVALLFVGLAFPAVRLLIGPELPAFIPPEESARPGLVGGLAAGVLEEAVFRLLLLPAMLTSVPIESPPGVRFLWSGLAVGLAFAVTHELAAAAPGVAPGQFLVRAVLPGLLMTLACRWPGFTFVVVGHCTAHLLLPWLFA